MQDNSTLKREILTLNNVKYDLEVQNNENSQLRDVLEKIEGEKVDMQLDFIEIKRENEKLRGEVERLKKFRSPSRERAPRDIPLYDEKPTRDVDNRYSSPSKESVIQQVPHGLQTPQKQVSSQPSEYQTRQSFQTAQTEQIDPY